MIIPHNKIVALKQPLVWSNHGTGSLRPGKSPQLQQSERIGSNIYSFLGLLLCCIFHQRLSVVFLDLVLIHLLTDVMNL